MGTFRIELEEDHLKEITGVLYSTIYKHEIIINSQDGNIKFNICSNKASSFDYKLETIKDKLMNFFPVKKKDIHVNVLFEKNTSVTDFRDLKSDLISYISKLNNRTRIFSRFCKDINIGLSDITFLIGNKYFNTISSLCNDIKNITNEVAKKSVGKNNFNIKFETFDDTAIYQRVDEKNRKEAEKKISDKIKKNEEKRVEQEKNIKAEKAKSKPVKKVWKKNKNYIKKHIKSLFDGDCVNVNAKVIHYDDIRGTKSGKFIHTFVIMDKTGAILVKSFEAVEDKLVKVGKWYRIKGEIKYDDWIKERIIWLDSTEDGQGTFREDNASEKRVELHMHTKMSMDDSVSDITEAVEMAARWGHKAIAITDHGVVQGFPVFFKACKNNNIKPIFGMEGYLYNGAPEKFHTREGRQFTYHIIILVKNDIGRKNLYRLVSDSHIESFYYRPQILLEKLDEFREGLILGTACEAGELFQAIVKKYSEDKIEEIVSRYDFLEVQPIENNMFMIRNNTVPDRDALVDINKKIVELGEKFNKPVIATTDSHFIEPEDGEYRKILLATKGFKDFSFQPSLHMRTTEEMLEEFSYLGKEKAFEVVVKNSNAIADQIEEFLPIPKGFYPPKIENAEEDLVNMVYKNAKDRYGDPLPKVVEDRIKLEFDSIIKYKFATLFYLAHLLVGQSLKDGYLVGSRGSVGSSVVARFSDVTEVNPLPPHYICMNCRNSEFFEDIDIVGVDLEDKDCPKCGQKYVKDGFNIPFQVFMGFEGDKVPDIDLNFSGEYQSTIHKFVEDYFGSSHTFKAGTISLLKGGQGGMYINKYLEKISGDESGEFKSLKKSEEMRLLKGIEGVKKTTGQHPGGVIVVPKDREIYEFSPINYPANKKQSGVVTTHFDYHVMDEQLVKLDMLGHDDPTIIKHLVEMTGVNIYDIPLDDPHTMSLFTNVNSTAIPEFGTNFVKRMLEETHPTKFTELIRLSGLSHGTDVWTNNAQDLIRDGKADLASVISVRDDIMNYLINMGLPKKLSFDIMESVRKGRGLKPEMEEAMKNNKVPEWYIESCKTIKYMFPKAHAVAYVVMAYRIAWFKVNYPREFYSAYFGVRAFNGVNSTDLVRGITHAQEKISTINSMKDLSATDKNTVSYLEVAIEAMEKGIVFEDVDIYKSDYSRYVREGEEGLRCPLISLDGLGEKAAMKISEERQQKPFRTQEDLVRRCGINKNVLALLRSKGCLDNLPETDTLSLF